MRRNSDESIRRLERQAREGGPKRPWLTELLRRDGLEAVQFQARSLDPETVSVYAELLKEHKLLDIMKEHFRREMIRDCAVAAQALVETDRVTIRSPNGEVVEIDSGDDVLYVAVQRDGLRPRRPGGRIGDWRPDWTLRPMWGVDMVAPDETGAERRVHDALREGGELLIEGPAISLSGRVTWPDWRFSGTVAEVAALRHYTQMRGKLLLSEQVSGYSREDSDHWHFDPSRLVRVTPTDHGSATRQTDDEWMDPYWDVELPTVPPTHTIRRSDRDVAWTENGWDDSADVLRSLWIDAPSYEIDDSGERQTVKIDPKSIHFTVVPEPDGT